MPSFLPFSPQIGTPFGWDVVVLACCVGASGVGKPHLGDSSADPMGREQDQMTPGWRWITHGACFPLALSFAAGLTQLNVRRPCCGNQYLEMARCAPFPASPASSIATAPEERLQNRLREELGACILGVFIRLPGEQVG